MHTKTCFKCKQDLPTSNFSKKKDRKDGLQQDCKACQAEYRRGHYAKNKDKYYESVYTTRKKRRAKAQRFIRRFKSLFGCKYCPENHIACLQFHHVDQENKVSDICAMVGYGYSLEAIKDEIRKCELVCANCHFKIHYVEVS